MQVTWNSGWWLLAPVAFVLLLAVRIVLTVRARQRPTKSGLPRQAIGRRASAPRLWIAGIIAALTPPVLLGAGIALSLRLVQGDGVPRVDFAFLPFAIICLVVMAVLVFAVMAPIWLWLRARGRDTLRVAVALGAIAWIVIFVGLSIYGARDAAPSKLWALIIVWTVFSALIGAGWGAGAWRIAYPPPQREDHVEKLFG